MNRLGVYHDGVELSEASDIRGGICRANLRNGESRRRDITSIECLLNGYQKLAKKHTLASFKHPELKPHLLWYRIHSTSIVSKMVQRCLHLETRIRVVYRYVCKTTLHPKKFMLPGVVTDPKSHV